MAGRAVTALHNCWELVPCPWCRGYNDTHWTYCQFCGHRATGFREFCTCPRCEESRDALSSLRGNDRASGG